MSRRQTSKTLQIQLTEKTGFEQFLFDIKQNIFSVLFVLLKTEDSSYFEIFTEVVFDYLQIMQFPFHEKVMSV